jgi:hypothetical protein
VFTYTILMESSSILLTKESVDIATAVNINKRFIQLI